MLEGDADNPDEATVAHLNGCRVLHTMATRNPVLSKRAAGRWGLTTQPAQWRPALKAALRCYDALATNADIELLRHSMPLFVNHVRNQVPTVEPRASGPPRWT